jgi:hypothetical protein
MQFLPTVGPVHKQPIMIAIVFHIPQNALTFHLTNYISSTNLSVIVIKRITHCFLAPSEPSLQCIGSSSNGSDSCESIKTFDRHNHFDSTEDTAIQTARTARF